MRQSPGSKNTENEDSASYIHVHITNNMYDYHMSDMGHFSSGKQNMMSHKKVYSDKQSNHVKNTRCLLVHDYRQQSRGDKLICLVASVRPAVDALMVECFEVQPSTARKSHETENQPDILLKGSITNCVCQ